MYRIRNFSSVQDLASSHIKIGSNCQRLSLALNSAVKAFKYPDEGQHLSELGDLTSYWCVKDIHQKMLQNEVGRRILEDKPRINENTFNLNELLLLSPNTFGHTYAQFMTDKGFSSEERPKVQYIPDMELAYVYQRYKEIHDFIHILLMQDISIHDELVVKWYEMAQLGLPSATLSATVGMMKLSFSEMRALLGNLDKILRSAQTGGFIMNVYFEEEKATDLKELRKRLGIIPIL